MKQYQASPGSSSVFPHTCSAWSPARTYDSQETEWPTFFFCLLGVPEDLSYLQDDTLGKYKSIKMHLMHPFLDLST